MRCNLKHEVMWSESNTNLLPKQQPGPVGNIRTFLNSAQFYIKVYSLQKKKKLSSFLNEHNSFAKNVRKNEAQSVAVNSVMW